MEADERSADLHERARLRRLLTGVVSGLVVITLGIVLLRPTSEQRGGPAPSFSLTALDGTTLTDEDLTATPVVVNLWASWCGPCRDEAPIFEKLSNEYEGRVEFLGVNVQDTEDRAREFVEEFGITYRIVFDHDRELARALDYFGLPETFFFSSGWRFPENVSGALAGDEIEGGAGGRSTVVLGGLSEDDLRERIEALLAAEDPG